MKTRIGCTYPDLESWEGLWSLVNNAWEPHFDSPPPFMHFLRKNTLQREKGVSNCVLSKNKPLYISLLSSWRSLVKLTPTWGSWERGRATNNFFLMDAITTLSLASCFLSSTFYVVCAYLYLNIWHLYIECFNSDLWPSLLLDCWNAANAGVQAYMTHYMCLYSCIWSEQLISLHLK